MIIGCYSQFLRVTRGSKESTIKHYIQALNTINRILSESNIPIKDVFSISCANDLKVIELFLRTNAEYIQKNRDGNNMYSVAFNHFCTFVNDEAYFNSFRVKKLDNPVLIDNGTVQGNNSIIMEQAIRAEDYKCTVDRGHQSFESNVAKHLFMIGHHLVPLEYQKSFKVSLDVYANIVSLCPICKSKIHYGRIEDRINMLDVLFDIRKDRLINAGINVTLNNILEFYNCMGDFS